LFRGWFFGPTYPVPHAILLVFHWLARECGDRQWHFTGARRPLTIYGMDCKRDDLLQQDWNSSAVGARIIDREQCYWVAKPDVHRIYSSEDAVLLAIKNGHPGPWDESEQSETQAAFKQVTPWHTLC
jgi:hypothetical protein